MSDPKTIPPAVSEYFRTLQAKGVKTKLATTTKAARRKHAIDMNNARWAKRKQISGNSSGE